MSVLTAEARKQLSESYRATIASVASQYKEIEKVILFGSWVLGNAKNGSDIDLAISGSDIDARTVGSFFTQLEEQTNIPNFFDVLHLEKIANNDLVDHIKTHGQIIYSRKHG